MDAGTFPYLEIKKSPLSRKRSLGWARLPESLWPLENVNYLRQDLFKGSGSFKLKQNVAKTQTHNQTSRRQTREQAVPEEKGLSGLSCSVGSFSVHSFRAVDVGGTG